MNINLGRRATMPAMFLLVIASQSQAALIDFSAVQFTSFAPNPIAPGERPTSFGYEYDFNKETNATVSVGFNFSIFLSPNAIFNDVDDIPLGTFNGATGPLGGVSGHASGTTSNPNGITSFQVPPATAPGEYNAFMMITPRSPHIDPDAGGAFGLLPSPVIVALPTLLGDYDGSGSVDGADLDVWHTMYGQLGTGLNADGDNDNDVDGADFLIWQRQFGSGRPSQVDMQAVPEPASQFLLFLTTVTTVMTRVRALGRGGSFREVCGGSDAILL